MYQLLNVVRNQYLKVFFKQVQKENYPYNTYFADCLKKLFITAFLFAALTLIHFISNPLKANIFNSQYFVLENGMQVVAIPNHRAPVVTHMLWYKVGSADDPIGKSGLAHFVEHLMFKGTDKLPSGEFSRIVAENGGQENAFTSCDYTAYFQRVARDRLEVVMKLEAGRMRGLVVNEQEAGTEKGVLLEERSTRTDNQPAALLSEQMGSAQFLRHPYGTPIIGWRHEIENLSHEDAIKFYKKFYSPANAVLIVSGDITIKELRPLAEKYYGAISPLEFSTPIRPIEPPHRSARKVSLIHERVVNPSITRSYLAAGASDLNDALALGLFAEILGGASTGRLYKSLVEKNTLATWAGTSYQSDTKDYGRFFIYCEALSGVRILELEIALDMVIEELLLKGPSKEEVSSAKARLQTGIYLALDNPYAAAQIFGRALSLGLTVNDIETWPDRVEAITRTQIISTARKTLRKEGSVTGYLLPSKEDE